MGKVSLHLQPAQSLPSWKGTLMTKFLDAWWWWWWWGWLWWWWWWCVIHSCGYVLANVRARFKPSSNSTHWAGLHWTIVRNKALPISLFPTPPLTVMRALWRAQHTVKWISKPHRQQKGQLAISVHGSSPRCRQFFRDSQTPSNSCEYTRYHSAASWEHFPFLWIHN